MKREKMLKPAIEIFVSMLKNDDEKYHSYLSNGGI